MTTANKYPWQVRVMLTEDTGQLGFCGGSLLSGSWVLTAAHCVDDELMDSIKVVLGDHYRSFKEKNEVSRPVVRKVVHPLYSLDSLDYDIALLQLSQPVTLTRWVQPVCLPARRSYVGMVGTAVGWGVDKIDQAAINMDMEIDYYYEYGEEYENDGDTPLPTGSDALKEVDLLIVPQSQCGPDNDDVTPRMLCAKGKAGKDACDSDSGGPLLVRLGGHYEVVGVISFGSGDAVLGCGDPFNAGVYANVAVMKSWILQFVTDIPC